MNQYRIGLFVLFLACPSVWAQRLEVDKSDYDFGKVYAGTTVEHVFQLKNGGGKPLRIESFRTSCAPCSAALLSGKTIAPGETADFRVSYYAKVDAGSHSASIFIHSNDPDESIRKVTLALSVVSTEGLPRAQCEPAKIDTGVLSPGQKPVLKIALANPQTAREPLLVKEIAGSAGWQLHGAAPREIAPGATAVLSVELQAATPGILTEYVNVATSDPVTPIVCIPIVGYVDIGAKSAGAVAANGLIIQPLGEAAALPGAGGGFIKSLSVENGNSRAVKVRFPAGPDSLARAEPGESLIEPGKTAVVQLHLLPEQVGKTQAIRIEVDYPVITQAPKQK